MGTIVPGARLPEDQFGRFMADKKGRPMWNMPKPSRHAVHFKDAAFKAKYKIITPETPSDAFNVVPVFHGIDSYIHKKRQANVKRAAAGRWTN